MSKISFILLIIICNKMTFFMSAPNKTKAKNASISNSTTIWFSVVGTLVSLASLIVTIAR